jgi:hypothetical protein
VKERGKEEIIRYRWKEIKEERYWKLVLRYECLLFCVTTDVYFNLG